MTFNLEPVKRDGNGKLIADYEVRDFYEKISEELLEAHEAAVHGAGMKEIMELLHVMTVCTTRINALGCPHLLLAEFQQTVIRHNRERGYFDEVPS